MAPPVSPARRVRIERRPVIHVVAPGFEVARLRPRSRETVTAFLRRSGWARRDPHYGWQFRRGLPTILLVNGEPVLRKQWRRTRIAENDSIMFLSHPLGGAGGSGSKQVIGLVALVALTAFSGGIASGIAGAILPEGFAATAGTLGLIQGAVVVGGGLQVNSLRHVSFPPEGFYNVGG